MNTVFDFPTDLLIKSYIDERMTQGLGPGSTEKLFDDLRELLISKAEYDFEKTLNEYPFHVKAPLEHERRLKSHLRRMFESDQYCAFPSGAMGKYQDCVNWILFKDSKDATLFKLTHL